MMILPAFEKFYDANIGTRWWKWSAKFRNLLTAINSTDDTRKKALLLCYTRDEVFDIFNSFMAEQQDIGAVTRDAVIRPNKYVAPKQNTTFETFKFACPAKGK